MGSAAAPGPAGLCLSRTVHDDAIFLAAHLPHACPGARSHPSWRPSGAAFPDRPQPVAARRDEMA
ncbi:hypothetical protein, partial [Escherichia coli]|uniref:hypothetical protein n=1 Tax=Escherichia coli TaxID=562 RepID=UPI003CFB18C2